MRRLEVLKQRNCLYTFLVSIRSNYQINSCILHLLHSPGYTEWYTFNTFARLNILVRADAGLFLLHRNRRRYYHGQSFAGNAEHCMLFGGLNMVLLCVKSHSLLDNTQKTGQEPKLSITVVSRHFDTDTTSHDFNYVLSINQCFSCSIRINE